MQFVQFVSRVAAEAMTPPPGAVIISIHDSRQPPASLQEGWADRLTLQFNDCDLPAEGQELFSSEQARQVLDFVDRHSAEASGLVVHCQMGQSRSAAVALFFAEEMCVPCYSGKREVTAAQCSLYNRHVLSTLIDVRYADVGPASAFGEVVRE